MIKKIGTGLALTFWTVAAANSYAALGPANFHPLDNSKAKPKSEYQAKPDFARVERFHPLSHAVLGDITPEQLKTLNQEQLDQLYARLKSGPMPDGPYRGGAYFAPGSGFEHTSSLMTKVFKAPVGMPSAAAAAAAGIDSKILFGKLAETIWKGKVFQDGTLRNMIDDVDTVKQFLKFDETKARTIDFDGKKRYLLFPAKVFCAQSLLDSRRESIVIDYAFGDELPDYQPQVDDLAGRKGLQIRDEIRMVRPGLYLGRAYMAKSMVLNFILSKDELVNHVATDAEWAAAEDVCWTGANDQKHW